MNSGELLIISNFVTICHRAHLHSGFECQRGFSRRLGVPTFSILPHPSLPCLFRLYILLIENTNVYTTSLSLRSNEKWFDILYFVTTGPLERSIFGAGVELGDRCRFHTGGSRMYRLCPVSGGACRFEKEHRLSAQLAFTELQSYFG
jgi:hypothetical protein